MSPQETYRSREVSMERNRDLRDYALVNGFSYAKDFLAYLGDRLNPGDRFLDMGCGNARAVSEASRELSQQGVQCLALDYRLPDRKYKSLQYLSRSFDDTGLDDNSVKLIYSVCGLLMYARDPAALYCHALEARRILKDEGEISAVVDPVVFTSYNQERVTELRERIRMPRGTHSKEEKDTYEELEDIRRRRSTQTTIQRVMTREAWIQSPYDATNRFKIDISYLLKEAGLTVKQRILPNGGKMIDDEITLIIAKQ